MNTNTIRWGHVLTTIDYGWQAFIPIVREPRSERGHFHCISEKQLYTQLYTRTKYITQHISISTVPSDRPTSHPSSAYGIWNSIHTILYGIMSGHVHMGMTWAIYTPV